MSSMYDLYATDKDMETKGVVLNYGKAGKIKIARAGGANNKFAKVLEEKFRPHRRQFDAGTLDNDDANGMLIEAFAESVVLGWEGVTGKDGEDLKFSRENVITLFKDLPDLFADVREQAMRVANFRQSSVEEDAGN